MRVISTNKDNEMIRYDKVRFTRMFPSFVYILKGRIIKYGPFPENSEIRLPHEVAMILAEKNIVEFAFDDFSEDTPEI